MAFREVHVIEIREVLRGWLGGAGLAARADWQAASWPPGQRVIRPVPVSRKGRRQRHIQEALDFDITGERRQTNTLINDVRRRSSGGGRTSGTGVTPYTRQLLAHWNAGPPTRDDPVLFCQRRLVTPRRWHTTSDPEHSGRCGHAFAPKVPGEAGVVATGMGHVSSSNPPDIPGSLRSLAT